MSPDNMVVLLSINLTVIMIVATIGFIYAVKEMRQIHKMLNSRFDELISMATTIAHAAGVEEERGRPQERH